MHLKVWELIKEAASEWLADKAPQLGAALAYYTIFSMAPLLVLVISITGFFFGREAAQGQLVHELQSMVGQEGGKAIEAMVASGAESDAGPWATLLGAIVLLFGAAAVFGQLQESLDTIWDVRAKEGRGIMGVIKDRFLSFAMVLGVAFLLLVSLVISAAIAALGNVVGEMTGVIGSAINFVISFGIITLLFAMIYRWMPDAVIAWSDVWLGAAITALLFSVGKLGIGLYLGRSAISSSYGAAGSLAVLLIWLYYSAQIFLFGAELTKAYANRYGSRIIPTENAEFYDPTPVGEKERQEREEHPSNQPEKQPAIAH